VISYHLEVEPPSAKVTHKKEVRIRTKSSVADITCEAILVFVMRLCYATDMKTHAWNNEQVASAATPNYSKEYVVKPNVLKFLGPVHGKKVLELGCGNGYWLRLLTDKGADCFGVDRAETQLAVARQKNSKKNPITYTSGDISTTSPYADQSFDIVLLLYVLLEVDRLTKVKKIFKEATRLLKPGGVLIVADMNPYAPAIAKYKQDSHIIVADTFEYADSGATFEVVSRRIDGKETRYTDHHWTLEDILQSICDAGLKITAYKECRPTEAVAKKHPYLAQYVRGLGRLLVKATK